MYGKTYAMHVYENARRETRKKNRTIVQLWKHKGKKQGTHAEHAVLAPNEAHNWGTCTNVFDL